MAELSELLRSEKTKVVDVRTPSEFVGGHVADSINIPLNEIPEHISELKEMGQVVLCCASGGRSQQATVFLQQQGISCTNGGSWTNVNYYKNN